MLRTVVGTLGFNLFDSASRSDNINYMLMLDIIFWSTVNIVFRLSPLKILTLMSNV